MKTKDKQADFIKAVITNRPLPTEKNAVYRYIHDTFDRDPNAKAGDGTEVDLIATLVESQVHPRAIAEFMTSSSVEGDFVEKFRDRNVTYNLGLLFKHSVGMDCNKVKTEPKTRFTEINSDGERSFEILNHPRRPLVLKPQFQHLARTNPATLPGTATAPPQFYYVSHLDVAKNGSETVGKQRALLDLQETMAQQLLQASYGVDVVFLAPRIIFPRNEGVTHNGDDALSEWTVAVNNNQFMTQLSATYLEHFEGLMRSDKFFTPFLRQAVPADTPVIFHWCTPDLCLLSLKTLCAIAAAYVPRSGGNGINIIWSFGIVKEPGSLHARKLNLTFADQLVWLSWFEGALLWNNARNQEWPLSEARLIRLGLAADRARVIHHLMYLVGSRPISETGKIGLHGVSRSARFPGFNV